MPRHPRKKWKRARIRPGSGKYASKLEEQFSHELERWRQEGRILEWQYEPLTMRLAKRTSYTPDFLIQKPDGEIWMIEVKGFMREDAHVKLKTAVEKFPYFGWLLVTKARKRDGGHWQYKEYP